MQDYRIEPTANGRRLTWTMALNPGDAPWLAKTPGVVRHESGYGVDQLGFSAWWVVKPAIGNWALDDTGILTLQ